MVGTLACSRPKQGAVDKPQEHRQSLAQQLPTGPALTTTQVLHLRSECAKLGKKILAENPPDNSNLTDSQLSHYDPLTNRCYVELTVQKTDLSDKESYLHRTLWDGQTGALLADYRVEGVGCSAAGNECKRMGTIFSTGHVTTTGNKALSNTENETGHDSASDAEAFIHTVMAGDWKP